MFCGVTAYRPPRSAGERPRGQNSFGLTSRCWREPILFTVEGLALRGMATYLYPVLHPFARRAHSARCLKFDQTIATVTYPFHPLVGQSVSIVGCHDHGGTSPLVIRQP